MHICLILKKTIILKLNQQQDLRLEELSCSSPFPTAATPGPLAEAAPEGPGFTVLAETFIVFIVEKNFC